MTSPVLQLLRHGQSLWLDDIERNLLVTGALRHMVAGGIRGVTSNPTIFHNSISGSDDYDDAIRDLLQADHAMEPARLYEWLTIQDIQMTADILMSVYEATNGADGYVSLEVSPHLAHDATATIEQARHLWNATRRPNLMIKVPATHEGLAAIETLTAEGINVNVTLLFAVARYEEVVDAFVRGLARNPDPHRIASVASFFVSRIDTKVDAQLEEIGTPEARALLGRIAVANAKMAYRTFRRRIDEGAYAEQRQRNARLQRLLWGSTSTKNPAYPELLYVENLIGPDTVNTVPRKTLDAFLNHGDVRTTLLEGIERSMRDLKELDALGIDLDEITQELEREGVDKFTQSYDALLQTLEQKSAAVMKRYAG